MRSGLVACVLAVVALLGVHAVADAHVTLVSSEPAANGHLAAGPARFRLQFSEPVEASVAHVALVGPDGTSRPLVVTNDPRDAYVLLAPGQALGAGRFLLTWHVVSADGHAVSGSVEFHVGEPSTSASSTIPPTALEEGAPSSRRPGESLTSVPVVAATLRALGVGALATLAGLLLFIVRVGDDASSDRAARWLAVAAPLLLAGHLLAWLIHTSPDGRRTAEWVASAFGSAVGRAELWRTLLSLAPLWALQLVRRRGLALLCTVPALLVSAAIGHSAAFSPYWSIPFKALHLVALATWLGGLVWLTLRDRSDRLRFASDTGRVSAVALWSVVAISVTGVLQAALLLPSLADLTSPYGVIVLTKSALLGLLIAFGAHHRFRVMPRLASSGDGRLFAAFGTSLRREVALLWLVVLLGGFLSNVSPPAAVAAAPQSSSESDR